MGTLVSALSRDGDAICYAIDSTDIVRQAERVHKSSAPVTAALGRLLTAAALMGIGQKGEAEALTLRLNGGGPAGTLIAVADSRGRLRGCVDNPLAELPLNAQSKLDVAGVVGREGQLHVIRDMGLKEPYVGSVPLVSGEIAEDITHYYAQSQQVPTVCALGVLVNPDLTVRAAGGYIAQLLPGASGEALDRLESTVTALPPVTALLGLGISSWELAVRVLQGFEPSVLDTRQAEYRCDCSRERVERTLLSLGREELCKMALEQPVTQVDCHFCGKCYRFSPQELRGLAK